MNTLREQPVHVQTGDNKKKILLIVIILFSVALAAAAAAYAMLYQPSYRPPPFEPGAAAGTPAPPEGFGYGEIDAMGSFKFGLAGVMYQQEDGALRIYFTNPEENEAYLMCEVADPGGAALYRSGLLRPGEYVESLRPARKRPENEAISVEVKIYALDPEHYYSVGMVTLDNVLQPY